MKKDIIFFCLIQIVFLSISFGQPCNGILNHGIYDFRNTNSSSELASSFVSWYKNQNIQTFEDAKNASGNASIPLESIMVGLGFNYSKEEFKDFQSYIENYSEGQFSQKEKFEQTIKSINTDVVNAWRLCINSQGVHVWIEHTTDPNMFVLCANYVDDGGGGVLAKITSIQFEGGGVSSSGDILYKNGAANTQTVLNNSIKAQSFTRTNDKPITINVNLSRGNEFHYSFSKIVKEKTIYPKINSNCNTTESTGYHPFSTIQSGGGGNEDVQFLGMMKFKIENNKVWCYYDAKMTGTNGNKSQASSGWCPVYTPGNGEQILGFSEGNWDGGASYRYDFGSTTDGYTPIGIETKQIAPLGSTVGKFYIKHTGNTHGVLYGSFNNNEVYKFLGIRVRR